MYLELFGFKEIDKINQLVLVADGDGRKAEHGAVGQVGGSDDAIVKVCLDDPHQGLDCKSHLEMVEVKSIFWLAQCYNTRGRKPILLSPL